MTEDWRASVDVKENVAAVVVDLSKAFYSSNYTVLLEKLKAYGLSSYAIMLLCQYLKDRR